MKTNHHKNKPSVGNASTKLDTSEVLDLCAGIHTHTKGQLPIGWLTNPRALHQYLPDDHDLAGVGGVDILPPFAGG